jgi:hypothetical protein
MGGGGVRVAQAIHAVKGPNTTRPWGEVKQLTSPATCRTPSIELTLKASLGVVVAILLQGGPVVVALKRLKQLYTPNVHELHVCLLQEEKLEATWGVWQPLTIDLFV